MRTGERYSYYKVTNIANGRSVTCYLNDFGPKEYTNRVIDLSQKAFSEIGDLKRGVIQVIIEKVE